MLVFVNSVVFDSWIMLVFCCWLVWMRWWACSLLWLMVFGFIVCAVNSVVMYDSLYITFACSLLCVCLGCY